MLECIMEQILRKMYNLELKIKSILLKICLPMKMGKSILKLDFHIFISMAQKIILITL